jgi:uncharacterized protein YecE (DUF72 family)
MLWRFGTMGFSYADWAGVFYPRGLPQPRWLAHYAKHFDAIELDTTFHAAPTFERVERWAEQTPPDFRFCLKTPRAITHDGPPQRAIGAMTDFVRVASAMHEKLAMILIQFPPTYNAANLVTLAGFLHELPPVARYAVEFRHRSWFEPGPHEDARELLRALNLCWVSAEYEAAPRPPVVTTDFLYVRWIGRHERFEELNREQIDMTASLRWWADTVAATAPADATVWGMFNNDYAGYSVASIARMREILGLGVPEVKVAGGEQMSLF